VLNVTDVFPYHTLKMHYFQNTVFPENIILQKNKKSPTVYKIRVEMVMTRKPEHIISSNEGGKKK
jgi:hypothetical protein